jgi:hypothetical protein
VKVECRQLPELDLEGITSRGSALERLPPLLPKWKRAVEPTKDINEERNFLLSEDSLMCATTLAPALCTTFLPVPRPCNPRH